MTRQLYAWPEYWVNKYFGKGHGKIHHVIVAEEKSNVIVKEKILTTKKVTRSEEVDKGTKNLDDVKELLVTIWRNYLGNFVGQSKGLTGWFNPYHDF